MYIRTAIHYYICVRSSVNLHAKMLLSVLKAKIRFFDTNPIGKFIMILRLLLLLVVKKQFWVNCDFFSGYPVFGRDKINFWLN